jgi:hypothetical protein
MNLSCLVSTILLGVKRKTIEIDQIQKKIPAAEIDIKTWFIEWFTLRILEKPTTLSILLSELFKFTKTHFVSHYMKDRWIMYCENIKGNSRSTFQLDGIVA